MNEFLKSRGNVRNLKAYKVSVIISDATEIFVRKFISRGSRTIDQMQQAARSCKQNIVEGSEAAKTSVETEIKLTNVARASLGELLDDYMDYLRFNSLQLWGKDHPRISKLRDYLKSEEFQSDYTELCHRLSPEEFCNLMITLIKQEQFLLDRMLLKMQERFLIEGGIREKMTRARISHRKGEAL